MEGKTKHPFKNEIKKEGLMKRKIKDKNRKTINKNIAFSLMGMGLMLGLGACNASQNASAVTVSANVNNDKTQSKLDEGQIVVNADGEVNLNLDNFAISNSKDAPIVGKTGNLNINLADGSDNKISDTRAANTQTENSSNDYKAYDAALYSEADINISGSGTLVVEGGYEDAIHSKSNLNIEGGNYSITASHHGLNGKKTLVVKGGKFEITTVEDAMHSKGDVTFENGELNINAGDDALHADNTLTVKDGNIMKIHFVRLTSELMSKDS